MANPEFIAAVELGSSKITGAVARKLSDGNIELLSYARETSRNAIRKGMIYNLDKTTQCLKNLISHMENDLPAKIGKVYVGLGGQSTHTQKNVVTRDLKPDTLITQDLIMSLIDEDLTYPYNNQEIHEVFPQEYKIDKIEQKEPVGIKGSHIEGRFQNVVSRISNRNNILQCFNHIDVEVAELLLAPVVCANVMLTESEKRSGCALIDFGADTTTVSIYKNNILRHMAVIPLGGDAITHDIATILNIEEEEAEEAKIRFGSAVLEKEENPKEEATFKLDNYNRMFKISELNCLIEARAKEIILNVLNQIQLAGYDENKLLSGLVIAGGGSNLNNIDNLLRKNSNFTRIRQARQVLESVHSSKNEILKDGTEGVIFGLLFAGKENCYKEETEEPEIPVESKEPRQEQTPEEKPEETLEAPVNETAKENVQETSAGSAQKDIFEHDKNLIEQREEFEHRRESEQAKNKKRHKSQTGLFSGIKNLAGKFFDEKDENEF